MANTKIAYINTAATSAQTLPEPAVEVKGAVLLIGGATAIAATSYTVVQSSPSSSEIEFTGTTASPSSTITFSAAAAANGLLLVEYVPVGALPANA